MSTTEEVVLEAVQNGTSVVDALRAAGWTVTPPAPAAPPARSIISGYYCVACGAERAPDLAQTCPTPGCGMRAFGNRRPT